MGWSNRHAKLDHMQGEDGVGGVKNKAEALFRENYPTTRAEKEIWSQEYLQQMVFYHS